MSYPPPTSKMLTKVLVNCYSITLTIVQLSFTPLFNQAERLNSSVKLLSFTPVESNGNTYFTQTELHQTSSTGFVSKQLSEIA